jgi:putative endonuclease
VTAYVYMIRCKNNALYTGWTNDLSARLAKHAQGKGAKYTKAFKVKSMVYFEEVVDKSAALKREYQIKQLNKREKENLVQNFDNNLKKCKN